MVKEEELKRAKYYILKRLCEKGISIKEIKEDLKREDIIVTDSVIREILEEIKQELKITVTGFTPSGPKYQIEAPLLAEHKVFGIEVNPNAEYLDLMFTADYHLGANTPVFKVQYNQILDYCVSEDIGAIINLGDFYDFSTEGKVYTLEHFKKLKDFVEKMIEDFPRVPGIYQAVLGGNHDKWNTYFGFDFLNYFIDNRSDFVSLGNKKATLQINREEENLTNFMLVHVNQSLQENNLARRLGIYYSENKELRNNYMCSFLGHSHISYIDTSCGAFVVNSLSRGRKVNGAMHVRVYFSEEGVDYLSLKPIELGRKRVLANSEIIYRKP